MRFVLIADRSRRKPNIEPESLAVFAVQEILLDADHGLHCRFVAAFWGIAFYFIRLCHLRSLQWALRCLVMCSISPVCLSRWRETCDDNVCWYLVTLRWCSIAVLVLVLYIWRYVIVCRCAFFCLFTSRSTPSVHSSGFKLYFYLVVVSVGVVMVRIFGLVTIGRVAVKGLQISTLLIMSSTTPQVPQRKSVTYACTLVDIQGRRSTSSVGSSYPCTICT